MPRTLTIVTPENVSLELELANPLERAVALLLDMLIAVALNFLFAFLLTALTGTPPIRTVKEFIPSDPAARFLLLYAFALPLTIVVYHTLMESLRAGQTFGKQALRLRVIRTDGTVPDLAAGLIRNVMRLVDYLPCTCGVGFVVMLLSSQFRRLGDYAAGTLVIREGRPTPPSTTVTEEMPTIELQILTPLAVANIGRLNSEHYLALRYFLLRAPQLAPEVRECKAQELANKVADLLWEGNPPESFPAERLLEETAWLYEQRYGI